MLEEFNDGEINDKEKRDKARIIEETLAWFKVEAQVVGVNTGPAVTQFELQPAVGVKVSKITTLERDLALALAAPSIRIEAPIPGKAVIGIEIPNSAIASVVDARSDRQRRVRAGKAPSSSCRSAKMSRAAPMITDLTRMPHLLVAGTTGSGKIQRRSTRSCVALLMQHTPDELKLIMVDPKMVELTSTTTSRTCSRRW